MHFATHAHLLAAARSDSVDIAEVQALVVYAASLIQHTSGR